MSFTMTSKDYVAYINIAAKKIHDNGEYISKLDATTGDGDHWANINMGFENLVAAGPEMETMPMCDVFKKIGMLMMSKIGGSSGVLYGGAYMAAGKAIETTEFTLLFDTHDQKEGMAAMIEKRSPVFTND